MAARESIVKDFWLKLFSLALAVLIWVTVKFAPQNQPPTPSPTSHHTTNNPAHD